MRNALTVATPAMPKRPAEDTENRGELERLVIEPAENGFSVRAEFEPDKIDPKFDPLARSRSPKRWSSKAWIPPWPTSPR